MGRLGALVGAPCVGKFKFGLSDPISTAFSTEYKGGGQNSRVRADIDFELELEESNTRGRFMIIGGGVNVAFVSDALGELRKFHYDACEGGVQGINGRAWHPFSHFQFHGDFSDLPRLPSLIMLPRDVLEQTLFDLWPNDWPRRVQGIHCQSAVAQHHSSQRDRIRTTADRFIAMSSSGRLPLRGMQERLSTTLSL